MQPIRTCLLCNNKKSISHARNGFSVLTNPRIRCQVCALVLMNENIRSAPMLAFPRLQGFSITLKMTKS
ncbi:hypothetical protein D9C17_15835 [Bacillus subtilis subsp. subtilis]|nr:hypothetical protein BSR08_21915 [Bacillus subtilis]AYK79013.1 hypothetical protein D9C20_13330 [Bacillus subtilis subsp. subtilis]ARI87292.1 hypothetical protein B7470_15070 [Bacillus subtilis]AVL05665.1 hypothetical protein BS21228_15650 [Bacillus subtilis]AYK82026.1 hypothetical protein D9C18_06670 [Bacillus subtilis subsp. subtilis]